MARNYLPQDAEHPSVILLGVKTEAKLKECADKLRDAGFRTKEFREPDIGDQLTAVATEPICCPERRKFFKKYQLLKGCEHEPMQNLSAS